MKIYVSYCNFSDIAGTSVEQSENRYKEMVERGNNERFPQKLFTAQFITADCTKVCKTTQFFDYSS